ncbi:neurotrypsin-like [Pseudoliparis swirei]|uniref:neurotrypsin-like n=1 Tax=Pseudoliparis swirei TaxID=2059687 RepID=UPI0024BDCA28|nr:neurotrypsin-like [Pseudoliparis swirei]
MGAPSCAAMHAPLLALAAALWGFGSTGGAPTVTRPFTDCVHSRGDGGFYQGAVDVTESGARCLNWTTVAGFEARHPGRGVGPHNRCRNPDGRIRPWCFFRTPRGRVDWGYCDCKQGSVRLQDGRSKLEGRVEVYLGGVWGSVCSATSWGDEDAAVVCRQLGNGVSGRARRVPLSGPSAAPLHWSAVRCRGDEPDLLQCSRTAWTGGACPLAAAVTCTQQPAVVELPIRLVGGLSGSEGTVEVYHTGQWGSVCDDQWDDSDAEVVCRQLGLSGVARAWGHAHFGKAPGPVWLDEVHCSGSELRLEDCPRAAWGEHDCVRGEAAGVACSAPTDGSVRLAGGSSGVEGRVEVFHGGRWGTVCDDGWTDANTHVVCRQLGYSSGETLLSAGPAPRGPGPILLHGVRCSGGEAGLLLCSRGAWLQHQGPHHEDVSVACSAETRPPSVPLRLVGGEGPGEGRVELHLSGLWGTVCDDGWTDREAQVVCRQLGYSGEAKARVMAYFGEGAGPIHLDNVKCGGEERSLADCIKQAPGTHNCRHSEDAGVICDHGVTPPGAREGKGMAAAPVSTRSGWVTTTLWSLRNTRWSSAWSRSCSTHDTVPIATTTYSPQCLGLGPRG